MKTGHIQNGAVTDSKISGVISAAKLPVGITAGTVAAGDHGHDALYQQKYANIVVVAKGGGDFADPVAALNSITDASASNPYLLKIMPGIYDLGSGALYMKEYVDIEGSGENTTVIQSSVEGTSWPFVGTVNGASNAEIRFLSVKNTSSGIYAVAFVNNEVSVSLTSINITGSGASVVSWGVLNMTSLTTMTNVTVIAPGTPGNCFGVYNDAGSVVTMSNVTAKGYYGIFNYASSVIMNNVSAIGTGDYSPEGLHNVWNSSVLADHCSFEGYYSIYNESGVTKIGASKLVGSAPFGGITCVSSYDGNYAALDATCQ